MRWFLHMALLVPVFLTGCSGPPLASFDAERDRIRGLFSGNTYTCREDANNGTRVARCEGEAGSYAQVRQDGTGGIEVTAWHPGFGRDWRFPPFEGLMKAYGLNDSDIDACLTRPASEIVSKTLSSHEVICRRGVEATQIEEWGIYLSVTQAKSF